MQSSEVIEGNKPVPKFILDCPLTMDWCKYRGEIYFAILNYEKSIEKGRCIFDLAYCATSAFNDVFLMTRVWNKNFKPWEGHSMWQPNQTTKP